MHLKTIIFAAGIALGIIVGDASIHASEIAIIALMLSAVQIGIYMFERNRKAKSIHTDLAISFCTFLFSIGVVFGIIRVQLVHEKIPFLCTSICTFDAEIISSPESKDTYQTLLVRTLPENNDMYDVQLRVPLYPRFAIGESVRVTGKVTLPGVIFPHGENKSFDYASYLHTKNVGSEMLFPKVEILDAEAHNITSFLGRWKENMVARIDMYVSSPASSLASGMLFGNSSMSKDVIQIFRVAGLSHIIVLSGFNIAIIIAFVLLVCAFLPLIARVTLATFFVIAFVMMVGGEASILRATAMAFIALLSTVVGRPYVARQALIISLLVIVMYEPQSLLADVSLHLSFLATAGIVYGSEPLKKIFERYTARTSIVNLCTTTVAAYMATLPYVMYTFGTVSVYALLANAIVLPFVPVAMLLSFLVVLASFMSGTLALIIGYADTLIINFMLFIAEMIAHLPASSMTISVSFVGMLILYAGVSFLAVFISKKKNETYQTTPEGYLTDVIPY